MMNLNGKHITEFRASAISDAVIEQRGYESITNPRAVPSKYFADYQRLPGWIVAIYDAAGNLATYQLKPDISRVDRETGKPVKYEAAKYGRTCVDVPASVRPMLRDTQKTLFITEGIKKTDSGLSNGIACIVGLTGVWNYLSDKTRLPDWDEFLLKGREVVVAFDSDVMTKESPRAAILRFANWLEQLQGATVRYLVLPELPDGSKCGLDDWFANGGTRLELDDLIVDELPKSAMDWDAPISIDPMAGPPVPLEALPGTRFSVCRRSTRYME